MFKCCKQLALDILNYAYNPQILVADSAPSITKGFKKVFDLLFRIDCWAHTDRNVDKNADKLIDDKEIRLKVKADIDIFQNYVETDSFLVVARLMVDKWIDLHEKSTVQHFIKYFSKQWLSPKRMGWFDHYCFWTPVQNNALEGTNTHVKGPDGTYRERLGILQFLKELEEGFVKRWSTDRNPIVKYSDGREEANVNLKMFNHEPVWTLSDLTTACQWGKLGKQFKKYKDTVYNKVYYCTPGVDENNKELKTLSTAECADWFERREMADWSSFDNFVKHSRKLRFIEINDDNYKLSICSCKTWCKYYKCKHLIDLCSRLGHIYYDAKVKNVPIGANRRRGNPGKTKTALVFQPCEVAETIFSASESSSEEVSSETKATTSKNIMKKRGPKPKKAMSSESEESDFDILASAVTKTKTQSLAKTSKTAKNQSKSMTSSTVTSKASSSSKSKAKSKASSNKKSSFAPRK